MPKPKLCRPRKSTFEWIILITGFFAGGWALLQNVGVLSVAGGTSIEQTTGDPAIFFLGIIILVLAVLFYQKTN